METLETTKRPRRTERWKAAATCRAVALGGLFRECALEVQAYQSARYCVSSQLLETDLQQGAYLGATRPASGAKIPGTGLHMGAGVPTGTGLTATAMLGGEHDIV